MRISRVTGGLAVLVLSAVIGTGCSSGVQTPPGDNPVPSLASVSPSAVAPGGAGVTLTVNGSNFIAASEIRWNGSSRPTSFVSATQISATIPATDIAGPGMAQVTVFNPPPGGGTSSGLPVTIAVLSAGVTERISVSSAGAQGDNLSFDSGLSQTGRFVVFSSRASDLVTGDTNGRPDVFLRDRCDGAPGCTPSTIRVSVSSAGTQADDGSFDAAVGADGRFVAFTSAATNLVTGDTNGAQDVFLRDTCFAAPAGCTPATMRVSLTNAGNQGDSFSRSPAISASGRFIAFSSAATNLVAGDTNGVEDVFLRDTCFGALAGCTPSTIRVSVTNSGGQGDNVSFLPVVSASGRFVAFGSSAANLVSGDTNGLADIFLRDTCMGAAAVCVPSTVRVSVSSAGAQADSSTGLPAISMDGRFVAFISFATTLVSGDTNGEADIFLRDTCLGAPAVCTTSTIRVSVPNSGGESNGFSSRPSVAADGRFVAFASAATNLVPNDTNGVIDVFVRDTCLGAPAGCAPSTKRASVDANGAQANAASGFVVLSFAVVLSADGRLVAFVSSASNLVAGDTNAVDDIFLARTGY